MKQQPLLLFIFIYLWANTGYTQTLTLEGKVIDFVSKKAIPYVNIGFPTYSIGTSSNELGDFVIKIPKERLQDTLVFSSIGYASFKRAVSEMKDGGKKIIINLKTNTVKLDEFVFKSLNGRKLIKTFLKNRYNNYALEPALIQVFCRETMKERDTERYFGQSEAVLEVYKSSVKRKDDHVRLIKGRKKNLSPEYVYNNKKYVLPEIVNGPTASVILDIVKNNDFFLLQEDQFNFIHTGYESINDHIAYAIQFSPKDSSKRALLSTDFDFYRGTVYIDTMSFAVIRAEFDMSSRGIRVNNLSKVPVKLQARNFIVNYTEYNNKWYFKSAQVKNSYVHPEAHLELSHTIENFATEIKTDNIKKFSVSKEFRIDESLGDKITHFDDSFWEDYNFIKSTDTSDESKPIEQEVSLPAPPLSTKAIENNIPSPQKQEEKPLLIHPVKTPMIARPSGVIFTKLPFDDAVKLAAKQNKAIYIDFYADWCGPCKKMELEAFTDPFVIEKLNTFFINIKADVDRGEGKKLSQTYHIQGMPTLLFIDTLGETLYRNMGYNSVRSYKYQLDEALNTTAQGTRYILFEEKYQSYKKPPSDFMERFLNYRRALGMNNQNLLDTYIASLSADSLHLKVNEKIVLQYAFDLEGKTFDYLLKNKTQMPFALKLKSMTIMNLKEAIDNKNKRHLTKILKANELIQTDPSVSRLENSIMAMDFYRKTGDEKHFHETVMDFLKINTGSTSEIVKNKITDLAVYYKENMKNKKHVAEFEAAVALVVADK